MRVLGENGPALGGLYIAITRDSICLCLLKSLRRIEPSTVIHLATLLRYASTAGRCRPLPAGQVSHP